MSNKQLADLLFPHITKTIEDIEISYPDRELNSNAIVTRIGPSPTGFIHLGNLYNAIIAERLAHQSEGTFYLRIEDTDNKREVKGAVDIILTAMEHFGIYFDEGAVSEGDKGCYGPYRQRQRKNIYQVYAKYLVELGLAYPCFCSEEELTGKRQIQMELKENIGYYGTWAACRNLTYEEIEQRIEAKEPYVLRFRSSWNSGKAISVKDAIRGELTMPENILDFVLLKSDGIPTYHFAHVIDDHLMKTTHVIRGEEWLPSLPMHIQLFDTFRWKRPIYCHTATLMKMDGTSKRKLSKRKDPELALAYYQQEGYIPEAVWDYLLTILNSNYEEWKLKNTGKPYTEFPFTLEKMSNSGALFDINKLNDISKEVLCRMPGDEIYTRWLKWAEEWDTEYSAVLRRDKELAVNALIIGRNTDKVRKDLINWKQTGEFMSMYFDEYFTLEDSFPPNISEVDKKLFLKRYLEEITFTEDKTQWFDKVRSITGEIGYAANMKEFKKTPELFKGNIVDLTNLLRIAITGRSNAPDIWEVSVCLGQKRVKERIARFL
jgi:glutamyl-tRNA synthetase